MSDEHVIKLVVDQRAEDPPAHAFEQLSQALGEGATVGTPDEAGEFEVRVSGGSWEDAVKRVFDSVAAAGADDHFEILEHPEIPEHWRRVGPSRPGGALGS